MFFLSIIDIYIILGSTKTITFKKSILSTVFWFMNAVVVFTILLFIPTKHSQMYHTDFFIAYLIELSLSIDNIFVFIMIFEKLKITTVMKRRILHIGIVSAIVMRLMIILFGLHIVNEFNWIFYIFGVILILGAGKMFISSITKTSAKKTTIHWYHKVFSKDNIGIQSFFISKSNKMIPTVNLLALILIEKADIVFAIDSIPAVISITRDAFIIFASNILAIAGLRSLFFLVSDSEEKFVYLRYGIMFILTFIGIKLLLIPQEIFIPKEISFSVIFITISISIIVSILMKHKPIRN
jgi:tellurite resistance protein TerC